jgi:DNA uptake protein ComE-like DNA-binding protein
MENRTPKLPYNPQRIYPLAICILISTGCLLVATTSRVDYQPLSGSPLLTDRTLNGIDMNNAAWPAIAQLPGFGQKLAQRVVSYREKRQKSIVLSGDSFKSPADLRNVSGIGLKTQRRITPYIRFSGGSGLD